MAGSRKVVQSCQSVGEMANDEPGEEKPRQRQGGSFNMISMATREGTDLKRNPKHFLDDFTTNL